MTVERELADRSMALEPIDRALQRDAARSWRHLLRRTSLVTVG